MASKRMCRVESSNKRAVCCSPAKVDRDDTCLFDNFMRVLSCACEREMSSKRERQKEGELRKANQLSETDADGDEDCEEKHCTFSQ